MINTLIRKPTFLLTTFFLLALFLRLFNLSNIPSGFHIDEVKVGWNAYSLLKTGRDDWSHSFPLHYNTFGDYRPTGFMYSAVLPIQLFGLTEYSVRFTPAIFGALAVIAIFFLVQELIPNYYISLSSSFFLAISPWHIALSRASSEAIISVTLTLFGLVFFIRSCRKNSLGSWIFSATFLSLSYFFYHIFRLLTPPLVLVTYLYYFPLRKNTKFNFPNLLLVFLSGLLSLVFLLNPNARGRFTQVSIFNDLKVQYELQKLPFEEGNNSVMLARIFHNKLVVYSSYFITEYAHYFSTDFLIGSWTSRPLRYVTVDMGPLTYIELVFVALGLAYLVKFKTNYLPLLFLILSPIAAALTTEDTPNLSRALFENPMLCIFAAMGLANLRSTWPILKKPLIFLLIINFVYFWHLYSIHNSGREELAMNRNSGVTELISQITKIQKSYSKVVLSNIPDNLYPWYAFYSHLDPQTFNQISKNREVNPTWSYQNIEFSQFKCPSDYANDFSGAVAFVDAEGCTDKKNLVPIAKIKRTSDGVAYKVWGKL